MNILNIKDYCFIKGLSVISSHPGCPSSGDQRVMKNGIRFMQRVPGKIANLGELRTSESMKIPERVIVKR